MDRDARDPREPALALLVELVDAPGHAGLADGLVEPERLGQRPPVLERVEAAGSHPGRGGHLGLVTPHLVERRDGRAGDRPSRRVCAQQAGPARPEDPLVATGRVAGRTSRARASAIWSGSAVAGFSYSEMRRAEAPVRAAAWSSERMVAAGWSCFVLRISCPGLSLRPP